MIFLSLLLNDFVAFRVLLSSVIYFVQDPYNFQFDSLKKKNKLRKTKKKHIRLRLSISKRGCSIPLIDRIRLSLKRRVCK